MAPLRHRSFSAAAFIALGFLASEACGQSQSPTALELAQLPRFCYWQFQVPKPTGDEFSIRNCGPAANHYCYALMYVLRAKAVVGNKRERLGLLGRADTDIRYTENAIKDYPTCSIRDHVLKSRIEVDSLLRMYGGKPLPPPK